MPASLRLKRYRSSVVAARSRATMAWVRTRAVRLLAITATSMNTSRVTTFSGSAMVKV